jgi:redox-sensing transcriptional repressor
VVRKENIDVGIITTPAASAQGVADQLVKAGVKAILNFAPASINVPEGVVIRHVDLAVELQILTFFLRRHSLMEEKMDEEEVY